jgi:hypothetical protein
MTRVQKKIVLMVEGEGDVRAVPRLTRRVLNELAAWDMLALDDAVMRIGGIERLSGKPENQKRWVDTLKVVTKRRDMAAVLVVLDGDAEKFEGHPFCPAMAATVLCDRAKEAGAGTVFSLALVFAVKEYESWLIAGVASLAGKPLSDRGPGVEADATSDGLDLEVAPRDAKRWLSERMRSGYDQTVHQAELTALVSLDEIRAKKLRSFRRFENAVQTLTLAVRTRTPCVSPMPKS